MQQEHWIADRAMLQRLLQLHPEWTQQELADWIGRSKGWVKKWVKRLREASPGDTRVLLGKPLGRKTPYPQTDPQVEERVLAIRDAPPEKLQRTPGPRAILYYLPRDPQLQQRTETLPRSTRTIWKILRRNDRISQKKQRKRNPLERPLPLEEVQMDFKDVSSVPANPAGKQQHVVEVFNFVDAGTSILLDAQVQADFHAQTALEAIIHFLQRYGLPPKMTFDRDPRFVGGATGRDFPSPLVRFLLCLGIQPNICPPHRPDKNAFVERYHRTFNQECIQVHRPQTLEQAREMTEAFKLSTNATARGACGVFSMFCASAQNTPGYLNTQSFHPLSRFFGPMARLDLTAWQKFPSSSLLLVCRATTCGNTCPRVAQRDVSSEPIGSTGHFTTIASLLTTSWAWFQDRARQIAQSRPRGCLREITSRCATRGLGVTRIESHTPGAK